LLTTKTLERLEEIASQPEEDEGETRVRGSRRRRGRSAEGEAGESDADEDTPNPEGGTLEAGVPEASSGAQPTETETAPDEAE
jgi:hypothetical protein